MNADQWERAKEVFDAALRQPAGARTSFVLSACGDDPELLAEVDDLLRADEAADGFLSNSLLLAGLPSNTETLTKSALPDRLPTGAIVSGRFEIRQFLGQGGMGQVYEARDTELDVCVALKTINPAISSDELALSRFKKEVQLTRRVTHRNVCRVFDLGRHTPDGKASSEFAFLTMELLEGETLSARLRRDKRLVPTEALPIVEQVAEGLTAAHALGIIHRDIKPSNIILVPGNAARVVITDFGLARTASARSTVGVPQSSRSVTEPGRIVGTLSYMAPEQLIGGDVTEVTDIYAFGLVIYEMVTGKRPFADDMSWAVIARRLHGPPPSPRDFEPDLDIRWEDAILGCLQVDPKARFHCARDVVATISSAAGSSKLRTPQAAPSPNIRPQASETGSKRRLLLATGIILAIVALLMAGSRLFKTEGNSKVDSGALVYLAPVKNETQDPSLSGVTALVQAGLAQSAHINLVEPGRVGDILQQMTKPPDTPIVPSIAREIALRAGAVRVVFVTITGAKGDYSLTVDVQQPDNSPERYRENWTRSWSWHDATSSSSSIPPDLLRAVRNASGWIRSATGESANDIARQDVPPEDVTTTSWQALESYVQSNLFTQNDKPEDAVLALQNAIRIDRGFALAYARLGDLLVSLGRTDEGYRAYTQSLDPELDRRLTRRERDRIRGMFALDSGDYATADAAFRDYTAFYDKDYLGWAYRAYPLKMLGRTDEAIAVLRTAIALNPQGTFAPAELAGYLLIGGKDAEAAQWIAEMRRRGDDDGALTTQGNLSFLQFKFGDAKAAFEQLTSSQTASSRNDGYSLLTRLYAEQGKYQEAMDSIARGIAEKKSQGNTAGMASSLLDQAAIECTLQQTSACVQSIRAARSFDAGSRTTLAAVRTLGSSYATASPDAKPLIRRDLADIDAKLPAEDFGVTTQLVRARVRGELLLANDNVRGALSEFKKADALDAPAAPRDYLARAYLRMAAGLRDQESARRMTEQALTAYAAAALKPGFLWHHPQPYPPGFLADELVAYLRVAGELNRTDENTRQCQQLLRQLRPNES
jgi:serine/threonine protein kinase/tetratricopeptide (TPR) repeat protein